MKIEKIKIVDELNNLSVTTLKPLKVSKFSHAIFPIYRHISLKNKDMDIDALKYYLSADKVRSELLIFFSQMDIIEEIINEATYSKLSKLVGMNDHIVTYTRLYDIVTNAITNASVSKNFDGKTILFITDVMIHYFQMIGLERKDAEISKVVKLSGSVSVNSLKAMLLYRDLDLIISSLPQRSSLSATKNRRMPVSEIVSDFIVAHSTFIRQLEFLVNKSKIIDSVLYRVRCALTGVYDSSIVDNKYIDLEDDKFNYIMHNYSIAKLSLSNTNLTVNSVSQPIMWKRETEIVYDILRSEHPCYKIAPITDVYKYLNIRTVSYNTTRVTVFGVKYISDNYEPKLFKRFTYNNFTDYTYQQNSEFITNPVKMINNFDLSDVILNSAKEITLDSSEALSIDIDDSRTSYQSYILDLCKEYLAVANSDFIYFNTKDISNILFKITSKSSTAWVEKYKIILNHFITSKPSLVALLLDINNFATNSLMSEELIVEPEKGVFYLNRRQLEEFSDDITSFRSSITLPAKVTVSKQDEVLQLDFDLRELMYADNQNILFLNSRTIGYKLSKLLEYYNLLKTSHSGEINAISMIVAAVSNILFEAFAASREMAQVVLSNILVQAKSTGKVLQNTDLYVNEIITTIFVHAIIVILSSARMIDQGQRNSIIDIINSPDNNYILMSMSRKLIGE